MQQLCWLECPRSAQTYRDQCVGPPAQLGVREADSLLLVQMGHTESITREELDAVQHAKTVGDNQWDQCTKKHRGGRDARSSFFKNVQKMLKRLPWKALAPVMHMQCSVE